MEQNLEMEPMQPEKKTPPRGVKRALYLLLITAILGGGAALLVPQASILAQKSAVVASARETEKVREDAISRARVIDANLPILRKESDKLAAAFADAMGAEEADRLVTGLLKGQGLVPQSLEIEPFTSAKRPGDEAAFTGSSLLSARITATMTGTMESFWNLLTAVEEVPGLRIVESSSREVTKPVSADALAADPFGAQSETETIHTVTFELITYQPPFETETSSLPEQQPEEAPQQAEEEPGNSKPEQQPEQQPEQESQQQQTGENNSGSSNLPSADSDTLENGDDPNGPLWNRD